MNNNREYYRANNLHNKGSLTSISAQCVMELSGCVQTTLDGRVLLDIEVQPGSSRQGIVGINKWRSKLTVAVKAEAQKGKANEALLHVLAKSLSLTKADLEIVSGQISRSKRVSVKSITISDLLVRLDDALTQQGE